MTLLDTVVSMLPSVPFLPPPAPAKDSKDETKKTQTGPLNRFLGTSKTTDKKIVPKQTEAER